MIEASHSIRLQSIEPDKNRFRQYVLTITSGLFGDYCLTIHWGRIGAEGSSKEYWHPSLEEAHQHCTKIVKKRLGRGYGYIPIQLGM